MTTTSLKISEAVITVTHLWYYNVLCKRNFKVQSSEFYIPCNSQGCIGTGPQYSQLQESNSHDLKSNLLTIGQPRTSLF